jgi:hypothetical protein
MTGFELAALAWGATVGGFIALAHFCLLDAIRRGR